MKSKSLFLISAIAFVGMLPIFVTLDLGYPLTRDRLACAALLGTFWILTFIAGIAADAWGGGGLSQ